jgi:hypothetical protein
MELAYRLIGHRERVLQNIRNNVITFITPVLEVDGRERQVDTYYFNKKRPAGSERLPLMYWGKYVAHDNNRDNIGQFLKLSQHVNKFFLEWHAAQVMHDLHEAVERTCTRRRGRALQRGDRPDHDRTSGGCSRKTDVMELTKRGVPGVWTYGFYDGWVPNYMFFAAHAHNAIGRFYEVQSYGPDNNPNLRVGATTDEPRVVPPQPAAGRDQVGPAQLGEHRQSGVLISLDHFAKNRKLYLENYWLKNKRAVEKGRTVRPTRG